MAKQKAKVYVDGSFNPNTKEMGCAVILFIEECKRPHRIAFSKQLKSQIEYGSNIAEMTAAKTAVKTARSLGVTQIDIYHDWNGLETFSYNKNIKERHKSCSFYTSYSTFFEEVRKDIRINFIKVKAHSNNELNCLADKMAKAVRTL